MLRSFVSSALALLLVASSSLPTHAEIDPNAKGDPLFPEGHPNITYLTDANWDTMMTLYSDKPWLVDFYHPFCPHCKHFVPAYEELAAFYKAEGNLYIGAISCMDHVKCRRVGIKGFPSLIAFNFDKTRPKQEVRRVVGTHTVQEVKDYVNGLFLEAKVNETGTQPPTSAPVLGAEGPVVVAPTVLPTPTTSPGVKPGEQVRKELWEESTKPMNQTTRLQDAGSAFIFGLKQGVFMGREVLEDVELDALKAWLRLVSQTFPGVINRKIVKSLHDTVDPIALLDFDAWDKIVKDWQKKAAFDFFLEEAKLNFTGVTVPEWQRLSNIFEGEGVAYRACALYTCGQWNMFHMLTMNPPAPEQRSNELIVSVIATMRRFIKHFFGCVQCRDHFLEYNNLEMVKKIQDAENKPRAIKRWLWEMHNAVNTRIRHPQWPKPDICPTCGSEGNWLDVEVEKWLANTYEYREVVVPAATIAPPTPDPEPLMPKPQEALRKETDTPQPTATEEEFKVKDAENGVDNPALKKHQPTASVKAIEVDTKADAADTLQGASAPPVSLFAWYILPVGAVGAYLMFVKSRRSSQRNTFRH
ncbi:hypothetical protein Poli38472_001861 [Pythium oligandrum]|uniref:Sulfhydryl oxidase n=1 Tax=Pythium oligandrum TaxID=41045 RepID=A0A8K1FMS9_PYTOL|nr:hypothetical protein Poli38472_001861 [Pythium oligandrum]|eukprot:TMW69705.1 hypothetical protein Poli38472_001861 [Pythium oligandrum]